VDSEQRVKQKAANSGEAGGSEQRAEKARKKRVEGSVPGEQLDIITDRGPMR
jgi:hypothetical protein